MKLNKLHARLWRDFAHLEANEVPVRPGRSARPLAPDALRPWAAASSWSVVIETGADERRPLGWRTAQASLADLVSWCARPEVLRVLPAQPVQALVAAPCSLSWEALLSQGAGTRVACCWIGCGEGAAPRQRPGHRALAQVSWDQTAVAAPQPDGPVHGRVMRQPPADGADAPHDVDIVVRCLPFDAAVLDALDFALAEAASAGAVPLLLLDVDYQAVVADQDDLLGAKVRALSEAGQVVVWAAPRRGTRPDAVFRGVLGSAVTGGASAQVCGGLLPERELDTVLRYESGMALDVRITAPDGAVAVVPANTGSAVSTRAVEMAGCLVQVTQVAVSAQQAQREVWIRCMPAGRKQGRQRTQDEIWTLELRNPGRGPLNLEVRQASGYPMRWSVAGGVIREQGRSHRADEALVLADERAAAALQIHCLLAALKGRNVTRHDAFRLLQTRLTEAPTARPISAARSIDIPARSRG
ncbi:hypothetical protein C7444_1212 [Sphaerotilus hippei]|uniref:Uncharacterized protein n=1 Tax=Sphaerotilus hippei TaxID=744406 RepID=A0A318GV07_9BURK|nr:hypothetical protein [Sphaerotilus hippei]PXW93238.1 hypothetical protein C7444_1212 [Sphaerotilus hippei]